MPDDTTTSNPEGADGAPPRADSAPSGDEARHDAHEYGVDGAPHHTADGAPHHPAESAPHHTADGAPHFGVTDILDAVTKERDEFKDLALRLQADFDNFRKRVTTQMVDDVDRATGKLVESMLPVLDACEAAAAHGVQGIESVWSALLGALQKQGLEALDLVDKPFDPATAEAVVHEPADDASSGPVVVEVLRTGYRWKGRVVRAAIVKVKG